MLEVKNELFFTSGNYYPSRELLPVQQHQIYEELLQKQKEFASEIYIKRIRERYL